MKEVLQFIGIVVGAIITTTLLIVGGYQGMKPLAVTQCSSFSQESGYETKFVEYHVLSFDCLAERTDGRWISTSKLREN